MKIIRFKRGYRIDCTNDEFKTHGDAREAECVRKPSPNRPWPSWTTLATRVLVNIPFTASSINTMWLTEARGNYFPPCVW